MPKSACAANHWMWQTAMRDNHLYSGSAGHEVAEMRARLSKNHGPPNPNIKFIGQCLNQGFRWLEAKDLGFVLCTWLLSNVSSARRSPGLFAPAIAAPKVSSLGPYFGP